MSIPTGERGDLAPQQQPLGAPIRQQPAPAPKPAEHVRGSIWRTSDGRLETRDHPRDPEPAAVVARVCGTCMNLVLPMPDECQRCVSCSEWEGA